MKRESRYYYCDIGDVYHLTEMSQREYMTYGEAA
jgi:hypothetical protein